MAKKSLIQKEYRRMELVKRYAEKRNALRQASKDLALSMAERQQAQLAMQQLPRDSSPSRLRNRCTLTGRPHGVYRRFRLSRNKLREAAMRGDMPGLTMASW